MKKVKKYFKIKKGKRETVVIEESGTYKIELLEKGAEVNIVGIFLGKGNENFEIKTLQIHKAPETKSNLLLKSVLFDNSSLNYKGTIRIEKKAHKADAYQRNENILISDKASVQTKPELEILADDVKCTHGTTIGEIDKKQVFYLMSRGIEKEQAKSLIIEGFFQGALKRIEKETIRSKLGNKIKQKLKK